MGYSIMRLFKNKILFLKSFILTAVLITAGLWQSGYFHNPRPNIIYIMIDTLRADHLGFNSYPRNTSPAIDKFAYENANFSYAFTTAPWTPPSVASQLSGLYSVTHKMLPPRSRELAKTNSVKLEF